MDVFCFKCMGITLALVIFLYAAIWSEITWTWVVFRIVYLHEYTSLQCASMQYSSGTVLCTNFDSVVLSQIAHGHFFKKKMLFIF